MPSGFLTGDATPEQPPPSLPEQTMSFEASGENDELSECETSEGDQPPLPESEQSNEPVEGQFIYLYL